MVNYLVAVDDSPFAKAAFYTALSLKKPEDNLYILCVAEDMAKYNYYTVYWASEGFYQVAQEKAKQAARDILHKYGHLCLDEKVDCHLLLGISDHVGEMICQAIESKNIDFVVVGRRGMSKIKRLFIGSTSKYVIEHAKCNVLVVKGEWGPDEEHSDLKKVVSAEEAERKRRLETKPTPTKEEEDERKRLVEEMKKKMEELNIKYE